jgi:hypothetical protein
MNYHSCCHFPGLDFIEELESVAGLPFQGRGDGRFLKIGYLLGNYSGVDDWQCRYIRGRYYSVYRTKYGRKSRVFWGIS